MKTWLTWRLTSSITEDGLKFSSSGREDVDVRCLGKGRPFYIEYLNPKKTKFTFDEFRSMENEINENPLIDVTDLQLVSKYARFARNRTFSNSNYFRDELQNVKEGEEVKTKEYEAVCICDKTVTEEMLKKINEHDSVDLEQETPIRVLHRRPLAVRKKTIHEMHAEKIPG